jgi:hypothetical protein
VSTTPLLDEIGNAGAPFFEFALGSVNSSSLPFYFHYPYISIQVWIGITEVEGKLKPPHGCEDSLLVALSEVWQVH